MGSTVTLAETDSLAFNASAESAEVYLTDMEGRSFNGDLSASQEADFEDSKRIVKLLKEIVVEGSSEAKTLQETIFRYVPQKKSKDVIAGRLFIDRPELSKNLITLYEGFSNFVRGPLPPGAGGYNYSFKKSGETVGLFIVSHELGHAIFNKPVSYDDELEFNKYAHGFVRTYVGYDSAALQCEQFCE